MWEDATKGAVMDLERRDVRLLETKASEATPGAFSGYGAVFGNEDAQGDVISAGAFKSTLGEWRGRGKWPPMLLQHGGMGGFNAPSADDLLPVGQWTEMEENARGLRVSGQLFALGTERGQYLYEGLKSGVLDGLSIGYKAREWKEGTRPGEPDRTLTNVDLWEVSIVTFPANPKARVTTVKALSLDRLREVEDGLRDAGFSQRDRKRAVVVLRELLQRDAGEPISGQRDAAAAGEMQELLAAMRKSETLLLGDALQGLISTLSGGVHP